MILGIDHIGLATDDPDAVGSFLTVLGMRLIDDGVAAAYGVTYHFWQHPGDRPAVELVAPAKNDSAVTGYLSRKGPGLYHIAFEVDDVEFELTKLKESFVPVDSTPCAGARQGMQVAFMYLRKPAGLLIELVQYSIGRLTWHPKSTTSSRPTQGWRRPSRE